MLYPGVGQFNAEIGEVAEDSLQISLGALWVELTLSVKPGQDGEMGVKFGALWEIWLSN